AWPASFEPAASAGALQPRTATTDRAATSFAVMAWHSEQKEGGKPLNCTLAARISVAPAKPMSAYPAVKFLTSANDPRQFPADTAVEVAVAGRSNAGKSSAINAITQRK